MSRQNLRINIIRSTSRPRVHRQLPAGKNPLSYAYHALSDSSLQSDLQAYLVEFQAGILEEVPLVNHAGEEFFFVLEGEVEFRSVEGSFHLKKGDSLHFDAAIAHGFVNTGKRAARALAVIRSKN